jgi:hypothetical protein
MHLAPNGYEDVQTLAKFHSKRVHVACQPP